MLLQITIEHVELSLQVTIEGFSQLNQRRRSIIFRLWVNQPNDNNATIKYLYKTNESELDHNDLNLRLGKRLNGTVSINMDAAPRVVRHILKS
jgi:hypothetical protein